MNGFDCPSSCPFVAAQHPALEFSVGQIRRVASPNDAGDVDETKRNVLKLAAVAALIGAGGGLIGGTLQALQPPIIGISSYPRSQLIDVDGSPLTVAKVESEYNVGVSELHLFDYPLQNEPNFLLNLYPANGEPPSPTNPGAENVPGGVGTHGSIVAFSAICQHLGCPAPAIAFYPPGTCPQTPGGKVFYIHCTCHGSTYDPANKAANLTGPAVMPLPQVVLEVDPSSGIIYANGEGPPTVNGHLSTLTGDYGVGTSVQLVQEAPILSCATFPS